MKNCILIYGANGFTGKLIARRAVNLGLRPRLAGRNKESLGALSKELALDSVAFDLNDIPSLQGIELILNCAGPFARTASPLMEACLTQKIHYLDITGEISVFEQAHSLNARAETAGIVLMPGVGFDVVPTDCLALSLKERMPSATHLELAFYAKSPPSIGTVKTMIENISLGGKERVNGRLIEVPMFHRTQQVTFGSRTLSCASIPWGDLATAYYSTGIPNIVVYSVHPKGFVQLSKIVNPIKGLMALPPIQRCLKKLAELTIHGPTPEQQSHSTIEIWGRVTGPSGSLEARMEVPEGYRFTSEIALESVKAVFAKAPKGYSTPAQAFGSGFVAQFLGLKS